MDAPEEIAAGVERALIAWAKAVQPQIEATVEAWNKALENSGFAAWARQWMIEEQPRHVRVAIGWRRLQSKRGKK